MRSLNLLAAIWVALAVSAAEPAAPAARVGNRPVIDATKFLDHVKYLASDELKGRFTGTPEIDKAARYIASQYDKIGLKPVPGAKGYLQTFKVNTTSKVGAKTSLVVRVKDKKETLKRGDEFQPFYISGSGKASSALVFAGYGITAPEYGYDDYAGLEVKDKIVVVLRREPQEQDEKSKFQGKRMTQHATFEAKLTNAKQHGAKALLVVNNVGAHPDESDKIMPFSRMAGPTEGTIPFLHVKQTVAAKWFEQAGRPLKELEAQIDGDLKPRSFVLEGVQAELQADIERIQRNTSNVIAYLPGETDEYVVIGGHYDHLGTGEVASLAPSQVGTIHPGADDNASGTGGVIEIARFLAGGPKLKRGVVFMAFTGEELGLLGSSHYANNPLLPLEKCAAMINMDMIGRMKENRLIVGGTASGSTFKAVIAELAARHSDLKLDYSEPAGFGGSDHSSFAAKQVPVMFFFSGLHADYHKPSDTWDKIDAPASAKALSLVADTVATLADATERAKFVKVEPAAAPGGSGGGSGSSGYGPYFGTVPDMAGGVKGVKFSDVRAGSPADKAGLKGGDTLIEFDGKKIDNLSDYTYALRQRQPGDEVVVKVLRDNGPLEVKVKLEARK